MNTILKYTEQKQTEPNFSKLTKIYQFAQKNKSKNQKVKSCCIESLFHMILLMDIPTLIQYNLQISTFILDLLKEIYKNNGNGSIEIHREESKSFVIPLQIRENGPISTKDLCIHITSYITIKLDQSGNAQQEFLSPFFKHFTETKWQMDEYASEIFERIIEKSSSFDVLSVSNQNFYFLLFEQLESSTKVSQIP